MSRQSKWVIGAIVRYFMEQNQGQALRSVLVRKAKQEGLKTAGSGWRDFFEMIGAEISKKDSDYMVLAKPAHPDVKAEYVILYPVPTPPPPPYVQYPRVRVDKDYKLGETVVNVVTDEEISIPDGDGGTLNIKPSKGSRLRVVVSALLGILVTFIVVYPMF